VGRNCNESIAKMAFPLKYCCSSKEIRFFCNTCILVLRSNLIVPFDSPKVNKSNVVAIPSFVPLQYHFQTVAKLVGVSMREVDLAK
jgi:hypothetical protein